MSWNFPTDPHPPSPVNNRVDSTHQEVSVIVLVRGLGEGPSVHVLLPHQPAGDTVENLHWDEDFLCPLRVESVMEVLQNESSYPGKKHSEREIQRFYPIQLAIFLPQYICFMTNQTLGSYIISPYSKDSEGSTNKILQ